MRLRTVSIYFLQLICFTLSSQAPTKFFINDHKVKDDRNPGVKCFQIRESKSDEWKTVCSNIDSFDYEEGFTYEVFMKIDAVKTDPPLPDNFRHYTVVKVLSKRKTKFKGARSFESTKWVLNGWYDGKNLSSTQDTLTSIVFDLKKKKVTGSCVCNNYFGKLKTQASNIFIGKLTSTKKMCDRIDVEKSYLALLKEMTTFTLDGTQLTLRSADGSKSMVFSAPSIEQP